MQNEGLIKKYQQIFWREATNYGGSVFYILLMVALWVAGDKTMAIKLLAAYFLTLLFASIIRSFIFRERPNAEPHDNWLQKIDASSFPSIHAARVTSIFMAFLENFNSTPIILFVGAVAVMVCISRIVIKKHYLSDVAGGIILGAIIGRILFF